MQRVQLYKIDTVPYSYPIFMLVSLFFSFFSPRLPPPPRRRRREQRHQKK